MRPPTNNLRKTPCCINTFSSAVVRAFPSSSLYIIMVLLKSRSWTSWKCWGLFLAAFFKSSPRQQSNPPYPTSPFSCSTWSHAPGTAHAALAASKWDLLDVYCTEQSQLTYQSSKLGLRSVRFGEKPGDVSTFHGRTKLHDMLWTIRPKHIWVSPRCAPSSQWNHLNAAKSLKLAEQISADWKSEKVYLLVCDALFRLQMRRGPQFHFSPGAATKTP